MGIEAKMMVAIALNTGAVILLGAAIILNLIWFRPKGPSRSPQEDIIEAFAKAMRDEEEQHDRDL